MQMVVAFRLVSYAQNGIPVSKASLMQNVPVRLPVLHDDDEEDELPPPPPPAGNAFGVFDEIVNKGAQQQVLNAARQSTQLPQPMQISQPAQHPRTQSQNKPPAGVTQHHADI